MPETVEMFQKAFFGFVKPFVFSGLWRDWWLQSAGLRL
jgi:hypothetical protein